MKREDWYTWLILVGVFVLMAVAAIGAAEMDLRADRAALRRCVNLCVDANIHDTRAKCEWDCSWRLRR